VQLRLRKFSLSVKRAGAKAIEPAERDIQKAILDYLERSGYTVWRQNLGGVIVHNANGISRRKNPMTGFPDLAGIFKLRPGRMFVIEVKTKRGRVSKEQTSWLARLYAAGVATCVARSLDDVVAFLQAHDRREDGRAIPD